MSALRPYQPFWCEENIWHLAAADEVGSGERVVLVVTGAGGHVACWGQGTAPPGEATLWDYHVVLAVRGHGPAVIWDLDTRVGCPVSLATWMECTFPRPDQVRAWFQPRFLVIPAGEYRRDFSSDRRHMLAADGTWQQAPPSWPMITGGAATLAGYRQQAQHHGIGLAELAELAERLASNPT